MSKNYFGSQEDLEMIKQDTRESQGRMEKIEHNNQLWRFFQDFQRFLSLEDVAKVRRHLIAIEKALFGREATK